MKDVNICHVYDGKFFKDGIQYEYESSYNTRVVCKEVNDPDKKIQFSCYETVQVKDEEAIKIKSFLKRVIDDTKRSLREYQKSIESLNNQKVPDET